MRRIKNVSDEVISVPALGNRAIQPGEIVEIPDTVDDLDFSSAYFEEEGTPKRTKAKSVTTADSASTEEGNQ